MWSTIAGTDKTAAAVAEKLLSHVGTRLAHSACVARQTDRAQHLLPSPWRAALVEAGWLHDIGYNEVLAEAGFHPLDGARWLRDHGWSSEVCRLVAWHTRAGTEAELRGLEAELAAEFPPPPEKVQAVMAWADMTSSPGGECCTVHARLDDILCRYPVGSVVHEATLRTRENLEEWVREVEGALAGSGGLERPPE